MQPVDTIIIASAPENNCVCRLSEMQSKVLSLYGIPFLYLDIDSVNISYCVSHRVRLAHLNIRAKIKPGPAL